MRTLTLTPDMRTGSVKIHLDNAAGVTELLRADLNGTRPVRLERGTLPATGTLTVTDWEPCLSGQVQYRIVHPLEEAAAWVSLPAAALPRFLLPSIPQFSVVCESVSQYDAARSSRSTFHEVIGRTGPLVAEGRLGLRTGKLVAEYGTYAEARDLEDLLERGQTAMYRQQEHPGLDMYFHAEAQAIRYTPDTGIWELEISYREVAFPTGPVLSAAAWTFDALADRHKTFSDVAAAYGTFHDLTIGETL